MFDSLKDKLQSVFTGLGKRGALSDSDVDAALREVRLALLDADVAVPVVKQFMDSIREKAVGAAVLKSVRPDQQVIKIVNDGLTEILGGDATPLMVDVTPPAVILMAGLQGSGKTTTAGKLAQFLKTKHRKKVMLASLDMTRPAAREQLRMLGEQAEVGVLPEDDKQTPTQLAKRALQSAQLQGYDVLILDTAGRQSIDDGLMSELSEIKALSKPSETLLVADALTGQDAVNTATAFQSRIGITGIILTRLDGDARGGAALSMRHITGCPIKFAGVGEKLDALEAFDPARMAGRILDMGDVVALVEKAAEAIEEEEAMRMAQRMAKGKFDLNDFLTQLRQLKKMGGLGGLLGMLPGVGKLNKQLAAAGVDDSMIKRQEAIILSMTKKERVSVALLNASRRKRIAAGSGTSVQEVNRVVKQYQDMARMMKKMGNKAGAAGLKAMLGGGSLLGAPADAGMDLEAMAKQFGSAKGGGLPNFGKMPNLGGLPPGINPNRKK
ncbi:MAG: signal recognition particle protein [Alphaproteobacteria bacterium]|nr:signal recognition particle protein [Alphaproteobacteria bacterium]